MILTTKQAEHFYRLWIPLLDFVNRKHGINKKLYGMTSPKGLQIDSVRKIRDALWAEPSLLDAYAEENPNHLTADGIETVLGWKAAVRDSFVVLRHLKSGTILLPTHQNDIAYIALGIYSTWEEMLQGAPLPQYVDAVLIPFENKIIFDSILVSHNVHLVGGMKRAVEQQYRSIKATGGVCKSINKKPSL